MGLQMLNINAFYRNIQQCRIYKVRFTVDSLRISVDFLGPWYKNVSQWDLLLTPCSKVFRVY